jgi:hypothetical protein
VNDGDDNTLISGGGGVAVITPVLVSYPVLTLAVACRVAATLIRPAASSLCRLLSAHTSQVIPLSVKRCSLPARPLEWPAGPHNALHRPLTTFKIRTNFCLAPQFFAGLVDSAVAVELAYCPLEYDAVYSVTCLPDYTA